MGIRLRSHMVRLTARRYRRILIACIISLLVSSSLLGLAAFMRWRGQRALTSDTKSIASQASQQLIRALNSRRGTLTFIRDTLNRQSDLTPPQLKAMGESAAEHTRHLIGTGLIRAKNSPQWWFGPETVSSKDKKSLNQAISQWTRLRGVWGVPSTFVSAIGDRKLLIMLEPLRAQFYRQSAIIGVFNLQPLLEDFFTSRLAQYRPVQILDGDTILYHSNDWRTSTENERSIVVENSMTLDAARWNIQMQPASTRVIQTLSWFSILLIALSVIAGFGLTAIVWILAARAWILQRAVKRRTAALRRTSERLRQLATIDDLTGIFNRRFFFDRWNLEYERAKRYQRPLTCLMVDVNGFKQVNDKLGHQIGDLVLKDVAKELKVVLRQSDILARVGGDEFILALPETTLAQAETVAQKLRQVNIPVPNGKARQIPAVSLSVGVGQIERHHKSPHDIIRKADESLYASRRQDRSYRSRIKHSMPNAKSNSDT